MTRRTDRPRRALRRHPRFAWWLAVFQLVCGVVACQISGVAHALADLASACCVADGTECPDDKPGHECPPGCPSCHCAHGAMARPPEATVCGVAPPTEVAPVLARAAADAPPPSAEARGVWRPPRAI